MKTLKLLFLLLLFPVVFHAQQSLTGLWTGSLSNDSVTVRNDQAFEIALTEYRGKVYGYSRSSFIVNDTFYYVLKRVKGTIDGNVCEIKDDEIVSYNFPGKLDKGIRVTITFRRNLQDSIWHLTGDWKTNKTKKYYAITGKVEMKSEPDFTKSKIFPHLEELDKDKDVEFYATAKKQTETKQQAANTVAVNNKPANKKEELKKSTEPVIAKAPVNTTDKPVTTSAVTETNNGVAETTAAATNNHDAIVKKEETIQEPEIPNTSLRKSTLAATTLPTESKKDVAGNLQKPQAKNQEAIIKRDEPIVALETEQVSSDLKKSDIITTVKKEEGKKIKPETISPPAVKISSAAAFVQERKTVAPQVVLFKSDSLELALYDNGEIDGDTVSVLLNGEIFMPKQGLKASAIKKTIYIQPGSEELTLLLYAENLGKYPPNTGLLVVHDGKDTYHIRFSADLQQNAAVVFRRKK
jgi:hypothetical protein